MKYFEPDWPDNMSHEEKEALKQKAEYLFENGYTHSVEDTLQKLVDQWLNPK